MGNKLKNNLEHLVKGRLLNDLMYSLNKIKTISTQRSPKYLEWVSCHSIECANNFVLSSGAGKSRFLASLNKLFSTKRFDLLLNRWLVEYIVKLFDIMHDLFLASENKDIPLVLEDNPLNRFVTSDFAQSWKVKAEVKWVPSGSLLQRSICILEQFFLNLYLGLKTGLSFNWHKEAFILMREAIWGLYEVCGLYFHDDFLVDAKTIQKKDLLLFSRGSVTEPGRLKAFHDAKRSGYRHFDLLKISLGVPDFFRRVVPKYLFAINFFLFREISDKNFSLYKSLIVYFVKYALPYEKVFSHYKVRSELGHNYFSPSHIPESIICENHGTKYYLMHWSDKSVEINKYVGSFLSCDGFLIWGKSQIRGVEGDQVKMLSYGYVFKKFIKEVAAKKNDVSGQMGITVRGRIVSFFDESFGAWCKMTAEHYLTFWNTAVTLAEDEPGNTVILHPKDKDAIKKLSPDSYREFLKIRERGKRLGNFYEIDSVRWSFIESIGISDIVITQGMTSSATIAIICGITGLYLDQANYGHPFSARFKDLLVFNDPQKLIWAIKETLNNKLYPLRSIPEQVLRDYDEFPDERGIDLFRELMASNN